MAFLWAFWVSSFRQGQILFSHSAAAHARKLTRTQQLPTALRYVKLMQLSCYHLSFALTDLLRTSRNLDCTETPRLQNKVHNMLNSNHSTKSNPTLTWTIMLWNTGMNSYTNSLVQPPGMEPWSWNLFWLLRHFLTSAFKNGDIKNLLQLHIWSQQNLTWKC